MAGHSSSPTMQRSWTRTRSRGSRNWPFPPDYTDVWICANPRGHLQAVGRDARGRRQYCYHPHRRIVRDQDKYSRVLVFGRALPLIRAQVAQDLRLGGLRKVAAAVVALLEKTIMRVGDEEHVKQNKSFGLTTLRTRHARVEGGHALLDFRGKHGVELGERHHITVEDVNA